MKVIIVLTAVLVASSTQITPIPSRYDGYRLGSATADYTLEMFTDHLCSACKAHWPAVYQFWTENQSWLSMVIHIFPLPYHTNAFLVGQAGRYVELTKPESFTSFIDYIFTYQDRYLDGAYYMNWNTIQNMLAQDTQAATGLAYSNVIEAMNNSTINEDLRVSWKYGCSRGVTGTPTYLLNGVTVPELSTFTTVDEWTQFFNALS